MKFCVSGVTSDGLPHNRRRARHHHHATRAAHAARDTRAGSLAPAPALACAAYRQRHRLRRRSSRRRRERRRSHPSCRPCLRRCGTARLARLAEEPHLASPVGGAALPLALLTQLAAAPPSPHGSGSAPLVPPTGRRRSRATAAPRRGGRSPTRHAGVAPPSPPTSHAFVRRPALTHAGTSVSRLMKLVRTQVHGSRREMHRVVGGRRVCAQASRAHGPPPVGRHEPASPRRSAPCSPRGRM